MRRTAIDLSKLKRIMEAGRWNTFNLSVAADVPQPTVWRIIKGRTNPGLEMVVKICRALKIKVDEILIDEVETLEAV